MKAFKYHGKVYCFYKNGVPFSAIVGSANLGIIKLEATNRRQYETAIFTENKAETSVISSHIESLKSAVCSANIAELNHIPLIREPNTALNGVELVTPVPQSNVTFYERQSAEVSFYLQLKVPKSAERFLDDGRHFTKSNINVCYAAPRSKRKARDWYEKEAAEQTWSVRTLQRNISSQYYYRMLGTQKKELVESEMKELTASYQKDKLEFIKNPVVAEFLGFSQNTDFTESDLEKSILSNLQKFLMELGKGYAFVARQQHIHTEKQDYYIDLVFYNYILKCFVLIDLKTEKITHQDVGQMDMYIRMYDELKRSEGDSPTIGIVLCSDTDDDIARYSVMHGNEQLFASKYKLYLPTKEELKAEIETQKAMFYLQLQDKRSK